MTTLIQNTRAPAHYYGDTIRLMFIGAALIMLFGLPAISGYLNVPTWFSITGILVLAISAGLSSPTYLWSAIINFVVAAVGFVIFEMATLQSFSTRNSNSELFIANLVLGGVFLLAIYFSVKTVRGFFIRKDELTK